MKSRTTLLCIFGLLHGILLAQTRQDSIPVELPDESSQLIEDVLQNQDTEGEFEYGAEFADLEAFRRRPLDLNQADETILRELRLLTDPQIIQLLEYRQNIGPLISIYELQAIPAFDLATIRSLLPFVSVNTGLDDAQTDIGQMLTEGTNELFVRWTRILEDQVGYQPSETSTNRYLGDPNQYYIRYRHSFSNVLSYGFTAEKDRGEEFFRGSNRKGFDYYSAHFYLRNYSRTIKALALGDFSVQLGQGLIMFTGFGYGKSALVSSVKRGGRVIRPYTSVNEGNYLRGAATTIGVGQDWELTAFLSRRGRDANIIAPDTLDIDEPGIAALSSLDLDGLHRTPAEIEDRNATIQWTGGGRLAYRKPDFKVALNSVFHRLDNPLQLTPRAYNRFYFQGDRLLNVSLDYSWRIRNFSFFGETATSDNGAVATINGLLAGLHRKVDLAVVFRHFPRDYHSLFAAPFAETAGARNETGLYIGLEMRPFNQWKISAYYDAWHHPWLRFGVDAPSRGHEYRLRLTHSVKRKYTTFLEVRSETKEISLRTDNNNIDALEDGIRFQTRLHFAYRINTALEWRTRLDYGFSKSESGDDFYGFGVYQDLLFRPIGFPLSFTTRFALFDTDGYAVRFYNYENGLLYNFRIPAYYNQGSRFYINLRYKGIRNVTLEARYAQLYYQNQDQVGSGLEATDKPTRTEIGFQLKYKF